MTANENDKVLVAFGEFVRAQRQLAQVSLRNLAKMSGVSDSYLSQIERGNYRPSPQVVKALAPAFGLKPEQLYTMLGFMDETDSQAAPPASSRRSRLDPAPAAGAERSADPRLSLVSRRLRSRSLTSWSRCARIAPMASDKTKTSRSRRARCCARSRSATSRR